MWVFRILVHISIYIKELAFYLILNIDVLKYVLFIMFKYVQFSLSVLTEAILA